MGIFTIFMLGVGLSMDAVAVAITNGINSKNHIVKNAVKTGIFFGLAQGIMPVIGFYLGQYFNDFLSDFYRYLSVVILFALGLKMISESMKKHKETEKLKQLTYKILFAQSIATSIDAMAVGVSFLATGTDVYVASIVIGITTAVFSGIAVLVGEKVGKYANNKAEGLGGVILILIGLKSLIGK